MNLTDHTLQENKGFCEDISEGKFSFPMIHSLRASPHDRTLMGILKQKTTDIQIKKFALTYLEKTESFQYTLDSLELVKQKSISWINDLQQVSTEDISRRLNLFIETVNKLASV